MLQPHFISFSDQNTTLSIRFFSAKKKIIHTVSLMISGSLSSLFDGNNWLIDKPDRIHISSTFWWPLISTKDLRTLLRNLGTCSPSRCLTDSSKNFIGSDFSDANTGAKKKDRRLVSRLHHIIVNNTALYTMNIRNQDCNV